MNQEEITLRLPQEYKDAIVAAVAMQQEIEAMRKKQATAAPVAVEQVTVTEADFHEPASWLAKLYIAAGKTGAWNWYSDTEKGQRVKVKVVLETV